MSKFKNFEIFRNYVYPKLLEKPSDPINKSIYLDVFKEELGIVKEHLVDNNEFIERTKSDYENLLESYNYLIPSVRIGKRNPNVNGTTLVDIRDKAKRFKRNYLEQKNESE